MSKKATMQIKRQIAKNILFKFDNFKFYYQSTPTFDLKSYICISNHYVTTFNSTQ